ncbi:MAG: hypothetical protein AAF198_11825 [Pseudomonadota bacterium]
MPGFKSRHGRIHIHPTGLKVYPPKAGTMQEKIVEALRTGATMAQLRRICVSKKGTPWSDDAIRSTMYWDLRNKGYGVRMEDDFDRGLIMVLIDPSQDAA